jgi:hypothetical protein
MAIRIPISKKNRQHNGQKKKYKRTNNDLQNIITDNMSTFKSPFRHKYGESSNAFSVDDFKLDQCGSVHDSGLYVVQRCSLKFGKHISISSNVFASDKFQVVP